MSIQPPAAPHRIAVVDVDIPFWRMVAILIKWALAAIPATIVLMLIFMLVGAIFAAIFAGIGINLPRPV